MTASAVVVGFALLQWRGIRIGDAAQQLTSLLKSLALLALGGVALVMNVDSKQLAPVAVLAAPTGFAVAIMFHAFVVVLPGEGYPVTPLLAATLHRCVPGGRPR